MISPPTHSLVVSALLVKQAKLLSTWNLGLQLRTAPHDATSISPAEAIFGRPLIVPADFFHRDEAKSPKKIAYETSLLLPKTSP